MAYATFTGVNDTALHVAVSQTIIERVVQESLYRDRLGLTQVFTNDIGAGFVRVPKIKPAIGNFRKLGATTNGGFFDSSYGTGDTQGLDEDGIELLYVYNKPEIVPMSQAALSLGGWSRVEQRAKEIGKKIVEGMNAGTMAHQIQAVINAVIAASGTATNRIFTYTVGISGDVLAKIRGAIAAVDNGDSTYKTVFNRAGRVWLLRPTGVQDLFSVGNIIIGGSNFAQEIVQYGGIDKDTMPDVVTGYVGMIYGSPAFMAVDFLWTQVEQWLGVSAGYLDNVVGIYAAFESTGRGHAYPESTKVVDARGGQGLEIQPESNFGVKVFFESGIKLLAKAAVVEGSTPLVVLPPGSQS